MANWYVYHAAAGANDGTSWANAFTSLAGAIAKSGVDVIYVAHDHVQNAAAALTLTGAATNAAPRRIYCVNRAGSVPPVAADLRTTAQIGTTGAFSIAYNEGCTECYGIIFTAGSAANAGSISIASGGSYWMRLVNCQLNLTNTNATSRISFGSNTTRCTMENCTVTFGNASQSLNLGCRTWLKNTSVAFVNGTIPTAVFNGIATTNATEAVIEGVNLSNVTTSLVGAAGTSAAVAQIMLKDCRIGSGTVTSGAFAGPSLLDVLLVNCDSGDTNYRTEKHNYRGVQSIETTIKRTGGASNGTTGIAWKIVTSAAAVYWPFESLPISIWNEVIGSSITVSIEGIWGSGAVPTNAQIWTDVYYLGTAGYPLGLKASSGNTTLLAAGTNLPAGSGTWGGSTTKFKMSVTITPQEIGPITIYILAAAASSTFYIDPKPVVT